MGKDARPKQPVSRSTATASNASNSTQRPGGPGVQSAIEPARAAISAPVPQGFFRLVDKDHLYYRIMVQPARLGDDHVPITEQEPLFMQVDPAFRPAFNSVWQALPLADRQCMLKYWRKDVEHWSVRYPSVYTVPSIRVVELAPGDDLTVVGAYEAPITFPLQAVIERTEQLPDVIATALAKLRFIMTDRFRDLHSQLLDLWCMDPDDEEADREHERLGQELKVVTEHEVRIILDRWNFRPRFIDDETMAVCEDDDASDRVEQVDGLDAHQIGEASQ